MCDAGHHLGFVLLTILTIALSDIGLSDLIGVAFFSKAHIESYLARSCQIRKTLPNLETYSLTNK